MIQIPVRIFIKYLHKSFPIDFEHGYTCLIKFAYIDSTFICTYNSKLDIKDDSKIYKSENKNIIIKKKPVGDFEKVVEDINKLLHESKKSYIKITNWTKEYVQIEYI